MKKLLLAAVVLVALSTDAHAAAEKGWFGFKLSVETSGFVLNPTVKTVKVASVVADSPAAGQQLSVGDEIIEAEGRTVPGGRALELKPIMQKAPGEVVHLRLKRANGETYSANLTALKRPS